MFEKLLFFVLILLAIQFRCAAEQPEGERLDWAIAVHGGAGSAPSVFSRQQNQIRRDGIEAALRVGIAALKANESGLSTVEKVLRNLEDNPVFNAGKGAVFNAVICQAASQSMACSSKSSRINSATAMAGCVSLSWTAHNL